MKNNIKNLATISGLGVGEKLHGGFHPLNFFGLAGSSYKANLFHNKLMKASLMAALFLSSMLTGYSQKVNLTTNNLLPDTDYRVVSQGANNRVWQRETYEQAPDGSVIPLIRKYTELATGLNYKNANGQWQASKELIESFQGGAIARQGQYQVIFANNLNSYGAIDMQTPDGKRLRSNILGLMYVDASTDDAVMIADIKNSTGQLVSANQVLYANAFDGVNADVLYIYRKSGFEQDVILKRQPPAPESYGLNPETTVLEVVTEFVNPPDATISEVQAVDGGEADNEIDWGATKIGRGKAFNLNKGHKDASAIPVIKHYINVQGRHFLLERVRFKQIQPELSGLPLQSSISKNLPTMASKEPIFPKTPLAKDDSRPMRLASATPFNKGYVLDYVTVNSGDSYIFQGDSTYYISGSCDFSGYVSNTIVEGGAVIKFATNATLSVDQGFVCKTGPYRPAVFTAKDDNSVGETIAGSTGTPSGCYAQYALYLGPDSAGTKVNDLRFCFATVGLFDYYGISSVRNCQFVQCSNAIVYEGSSRISLDNDLFSLIPGNAITVNGEVIYGTQLTMDQVGTLGSGSTYYTTPMYFTNCLFIDVTNMSPSEIFIDHSITTNSSAGAFQSVGSGNYYLATSSLYRNMGTTNIPSAVLSDLAIKTTYSPIVCSNVVFSNGTAFAPQAQRDTDAPDLGYHYDPIDYLVDYCQFTNTDLQIAAGTAIAGYLDNPGVWLQDGSAITAIGTPIQPIQFTFYNTVQEQPKFLSSIARSNFVYACLINPYHSGNTLTSAADGVFKFAKFTALANSGVPFYHAKSNWDFRQLLVENCEIGMMYGYTGLSVDANTTTAFINNLFFRTSITAYSDTGAEFAFSNNLFFASPSLIFRPISGEISVFNNAFDSSQLSSRSLVGGILTNDYNAYLNCTGSTIPLTNSGPNNVINTNSLAYQSGLLGEFYQPVNSPLVNAGSTTANQVGLYHFTTQTNQVKETNSIVDIGYHYVATDAYGNPLDADGDGLSDYFEDSNGNGNNDSSDLSNWNSSDTDGDGVNDYIEWLEGRNPRVSGSVADTGGLIHFKIYTPLK